MLHDALPNPISRNRYRREIVWLLVIKLILIVTLKQVFFNTPVSDSLTPESVAHAIIGINQDTSYRSNPVQETSE